MSRYRLMETYLECIKKIDSEKSLYRCLICHKEVEKLHSDTRISCGICTDIDHSMRPSSIFKQISKYEKESDVPVDKLIRRFKTDVDYEVFNKEPI